jgi:hypothetical protein
MHTLVVEATVYEFEHPGSKTCVNGQANYKTELKRQKHNFSIQKFFNFLRL